MKACLFFVLLLIAARFAMAQNDTSVVINGDLVSGWS